MSRLRIDQYLSFLIISLLFLIPVKKTAALNLSRSSQLPTDLIAVSPIPVLDEMALPDDFVASLSAQAILAIDLSSGAILLEKNINQALSPASTTKIATALVSKKTFDDNQLIEVKSQPNDIGHTIGFIKGQKFYAIDMLKALLVNSGNDAAVVLASNHPYGEEGFISAMNQLINDLHLTKSSFVNPAGLDAASHFSTAYDLSLLSRELMKNATLKQLVATEQTTITDVGGQNEYYLYNTNLLLGAEPGVVGIKTGTTDLAGEALITQLNRDGRQIQIVLLKSQDRYVETKRIIEWLFSHYQWHGI